MATRQPQHGGNRTTLQHPLRNNYGKGRTTQLNSDYTTRHQHSAFSFSPTLPTNTNYTTGRNGDTHPSILAEHHPPGRDVTIRQDMTHDTGTQRRHTHGEQPPPTNQGRTTTPNHSQTHTNCANPTHILTHTNRANPTHMLYFHQQNFH